LTSLKSSSLVILQSIHCLQLVQGLDGDGEEEMELEEEKRERVWEQGSSSG
jgi:hypothetical protein